MTICNGRTGDLGQRYEVRYIDADGAEKVLGWTSRADGGNLARGLTVHPVWKLSRVIDRHANADGEG